MRTDLLKYVWQFILLCLLQVLVFNNLHLGGYINPYPYIYLILVLPIAIGRVPLLVLGFLLGLTIDVFSDTGGLHAAATTLVAFYRPLFLKAQAPREDYEASAVPHLASFGLGWFLTYALLMVFIHHAALFYLEVFRLSEFFHTLWRTVLSSLLTVLIILLFEYLFMGSRKRR